MAKQSIAQIVTDKILEAMGKGEIPWHKAWNAMTGAPMRFVGKPYRGINVWLLLATGLAGPWLTFKECQKRGGHVKKGEKGTKIVFFRMIENKKEAGKFFPLMSYSTVFSLCQTEGVKLPAWYTKAQAAQADGKVHEPIEAAEAIWDGYKGKPVVNHGGGRAFYRPLTDDIGMPPKESFDSPQHYYSTLFHEGVHSTGSKGRLGRLDNTALAPFGSEDYSKEELVAELGSAMLAAQAGIDCAEVFNNSVAYLQNWTKRLKDDPNLILQASSQAQKAVDYILGTEFVKDEASEASDAE